MNADVNGCFNLVWSTLPYLKVTAGAFVAVIAASVERVPSKDILSASPKAAIEMLIRGVAKEDFIVGERRLHWGEECYLCTLGIPEVAQALLQKAEHSPYYRQIVAQAFRVTMVGNSGGAPSAELAVALAA